MNAQSRLQSLSLGAPPGLFSTFIANKAFVQFHPWASLAPRLGHPWATQTQSQSQSQSGRGAQAHHRSAFPSLDVPLHPRSSQNGVEFTHVALFGIGFNQI